MTVEMISTLIRNVRIFDGESVVSENGCILLENGLITAVSTMTPMTPAPADVVIDGTGHTVFPGLIDAHVHAHEGLEELKQALRFGVTTVLDMFSEPGHVREMKQLVAERNDVADFRSSGFGATVDGGWPAPVIMATLGDKAPEMIKHLPKLETPEQGKEFVKWSVEQGSSYIKLFQEDGAAMKGPPLPVPSLELQTAVINAAHDNGLITIAHALTQASTLKVLAAGVDGLAHCFCDGPPTTKLLKLYKKTKSFLIPTLVVAATLTGEEMTSSKELVGREVTRKLVGEVGRECFCKRMMGGKEGCKVEHCYEVVKMLKAGGIDIVAGTDTATGLAGTAFGLSLHQELSLYTSRCGFTPVEALRSATGTTARRFRMADRGRLLRGLRADVVLVKGNPAADIGCAMDIVGVWRGGIRLQQVVEL